MDVVSVETAQPRVAVLGPDAESVLAGLPADADVERPADSDALATLLAAERVDCVVVTSAESSLEALLGAVRQHHLDLPLVYAPADPAPSAAAALAGDPAAHYLPRSGDAAAALADVIEDAVDAFDRHRQAARERGYFQAVMELAPMAIYIKDAAGRNVAASSVAGEAAEDPVVGRTDLELFGPEAPDEGDIPPSYADDIHVLATGEPVEDAEERVELEGGAELWLRTTKLPITDESGTVLGLLGITLDVTPEKRQEEQLRRESRRLEQFASFASHDLRNPLTVANGRIELAAETGDPEHLAAASEALDRMEKLIDDLLEVARPDEEREPEWIALEPVLERAWGAIEEPDAELTVDLPPGLEVKATTGALRQLLENLLRNSVEHAHGPDGHVAIEVGATETGFYVADDGPGIPPGDRDAVFEYGYTTGGSGIGLAIVAEIAEAHGWTPIATESAAGGARIEIERCLLRRPDEPAPVEGAPIDLGEWRTVGDLAVEGGAEAAGEDAWTIRGGGRALWRGIEEYAALVALVDGDVRIEGRLTGVEPVHEYAKAGLLVATAAETGSPLAFVGKTAEHGTEAAWRFAANEPVDTHQAEPDAALPRYYRLDREDDRVTMWGSPDGEDWTMIDRAMLALSDPVVAGLAVCSHEAGVGCEAAFEDVRVVALEAQD